MSRILEILGLVPSPQSVDYVETKGQFHLYGLLTEQRHPKTWDLGFAIQDDTRKGLEMILSVDEDISRRISGLMQDLGALEQAVEAVAHAVREGRRIYFYGCGATGRLAKQMESSFWRPFWKRVQESPCWETLRTRLPEGVDELLVGEMTGADRALVSSLEGFEDLPLVGQLQAEDHGISRGDVIICVTEGGETSSVIGTILTGLEQYGELDDERREEARRHLYFVYNNPDEVLRPLHRSVTVLDNEAITRINLATGPQAIAGSTRMQATTSETFVLGIVLEEAIFRLLRDWLSDVELQQLGFDTNQTLATRLAAFDGIRTAVSRTVPILARFTNLEAGTYDSGRFSTYFARAAMVTVFTDGTERSPTFRLFPLDEVGAQERRCWFQVWTDGEGAREAWQNFLGRPFRGLDPAFYGAPLGEQVEDPYLREAALRSLAQAGNDQEHAYDFSFSKKNAERRGPGPLDLGVLVLMDEELEELKLPGSPLDRFRALFVDAGAHLVVVHATDAGRAKSSAPEGTACVELILEPGADPLGVRRHIGLKILLNAHSTAVMARLGRVIGNTMTNVSPSNLKLIGRATFLIMSHVNDALAQPRWMEEHGPSEPVTFAQANAVLFEAMDYVSSHEVGQTAEVALCIIRILEALASGDATSWEQARTILDDEGLAPYLARRNPALRSGSA